MKILFFIDCLAAGGKERRLIELMKGLKSNPEIEFELILMSRDVHYKEIFAMGIKIHYIIRKTKKDLAVFKTLYSLSKSYKPDFIHCWDSMTAIYSAPICKMLHIKLINGMVVDTPVKRNIFNKYWRRAKLTFLLSNIVIGNSMAGLKAYHAPKSKSICIHNGFDFERIKRTESADALRIKFTIKARYIVLMVGAFSDRKDYDSFIDAAKLICDERNDVEFIAVGGGDNFEVIAKKIDLQYQGRIKLIGTQSDVESIIDLSDICVLTTNSKVHGEGISNSILEYMALEKPVIASSGGGTNEIMEDLKTGFLIKPFDPLSLSEKIKILLDDEKLRDKMGKAGKQRIRNYFSIDKMVNKYTSIYKDPRLRLENNKITVQNVVSKYFSKLFVRGWTIGMCKGDIKEIIRNKTFNPDITWMPIKRIDQFYADPFFVKSENGSCDVLVEDFNFNDYYGKISLINIDKTCNLKFSKVLIDTKKHLSYPFLFRENNKSYVFPEAAASDKLVCYEYNPSDQTLTYVQEVLDLPVLDPTILKYNNKYWLFGTLSGKDSFRSLHIYYSDSLLGPYTPHPLNPVKISLKASRPAGGFIEVDGAIYRPSQNCENQYGESITINKISVLTEFNFVEEFYFSISIDKKKHNNKGVDTIHTINSLGDMIIVDGGARTFAPIKKIKYFKQKKAYLQSLK